MTIYFITAPATLQLENGNRDPGFLTAHRLPWRRRCPSSPAPADHTVSEPSLLMALKHSAFLTQKVQRSPENRRNTAVWSKSPAPHLYIRFSPSPFDL